LGLFLNGSFEVIQYLSDAGQYADVLWRAEWQKTANGAWLRRVEGPEESVELVRLLKKIGSFSSRRPVEAESVTPR
jgi:hypothetical protein